MLTLPQAYYAISTGMREAHSLLLDCVHYIQVLQLSKSKTIEKLCEIRADQKQTKSTIWFLLSLEKTFSLQAELVPVSLPISTTIFFPPPQTK